MADLEPIPFLQALGINAKKFDEISKNAALMTTLHEVIAEVPRSTRRRRVLALTLPRLTTRPNHHH